MVKLFSNEHTYRHPWRRVTSAFWLKYPNPMYPHVIEVDVFNRYVDQVTGELVSHRILSCESSLPGFMTAVGIPNVIYAAEESRVDPVSNKMTLKSRNLSGSNLLVVEECCMYQQHPQDPSWTSYSQEAKISAFAPMLSSRIENHGLMNLHKQAEKGLQVMESLCDMISNEGWDALSYITGIAQGTFGPLQSQTKK